MLLRVLFSALLSLSVSMILAQECGMYKESKLTNNEETIEIVKSRPIEKKKQEHIAELEQALKQELQYAMSEYIMTEVKGRTTHNVSEKNGQFSEYFNSQMNIETSTSLGFANLDYCIDKEEKMLYGRYSLNRKKLASAIYQRCVTTVKSLNAEIKGKALSDSKIDVLPIKSKYLEAVKDFSNVLFLDPTIQTTEWHPLIQDYNREMGKLENSQDQVSFKRDFNRAKDEIKAGNYYAGIIELNRLKVDYPDNEELEDLLEYAHHEYENDTYRRAEALRLQNEYNAALNAIQEFCSISDCGERIVLMLSEIRKEYFRNEVDKFRLAIKYEEDDKVHQHKRILDNLTEIDPKVTKEIEEEYIDYKRKSGMRSAIAAKNKGEYWESYRLIKELEVKYGKRDNELNKIKSQVQNKIFRAAVHDEKLTRSKTYSLWLGADALMDVASIDTVSSYKPQYFLFGYTIGVYRKYRFEESSEYKPYPVRSDFVGLRLRLLDLQSFQSIPGTDAPQVDVPNTTKATFDLAIDGFTWRVLHYNLGMNLNDRFDFGDANYYTMSLGFRLPLGIFSWTTDATAITQFKGEGYFRLSTGLQLRFDFNRQFTRKDKRQIRTELFG